MSLKTLKRFLFQNQRRPNHKQYNKLTISSKKPTFYCYGAFLQVIFWFVLRLLFLLVILTCVPVSAIKTAQSQLESPSHLQNYKLPSLSPSLTVTQRYSQSITTSTVRPWPSHSFFRSVLASTDNIASGGGRQNRTNFTEYEQRQHHQSRTGVVLPDKKLRFTKSPRKNMTKSVTTANIHKQIKKGLTSTFPSSKGNVNDTFESNSKREDTARSSSANGKAIEMSLNKFNLNDNHVINNNNGANANSTNRKFSQEDGENSNKKPFSISLPQLSKAKLEEASGINGAQVGFQYEIVFPLFPSPPSTDSISTSSSRSQPTSTPTSSSEFAAEPAVSTSLHIPFATAATPVFTKAKIFHIFPSPSSNDGNRNNDENGSSNNTTTVKTTATFLKAASSPVVNLKNSAFPSSPVNDPYNVPSVVESNTRATSTIITTFPSPPPLSHSHSHSSSVRNELMETKVGFLTAPSPSSFLQTHSSAPQALVIPFYESKKGNENTLHFQRQQQNQSFHHYSPPTQKTQLKAYNSGSSSSDDDDKRNSFSPFFHAQSANTATHMTKENTKIKPMINHKLSNVSNNSYSESETVSKIVQQTKSSSGGQVVDELTLNLNGDYSLVKTKSFSHSLLSLPTQNVVSGIGLKRLKGEFSGKLDDTYRRNITIPPISLQNPNQAYHYHVNSNERRQGHGQQKPQTHRQMEERNVLINRKNMFTVISKDNVKPSIRIESSNGTRKNVQRKKVMKPEASGNNILQHRINQVERPSLLGENVGGSEMTMMMAGGKKPTNVANGNVYFDEDDAQIKLHHWIESEQGHFVSGSTELPRFTNLTWPYYFTGESGSSSEALSTSNNGVNSNNPMNKESFTSNDNTKVAGGEKPVTEIPLLASTGLSVTFPIRNRESSNNSQQKKEFNSLYEYYIPSAAADPLQNPILVQKKKEKIKLSGKNGTEQKTNAQELWTKLPTLLDDHSLTSTATTKEFYQNDKNKVKHSHWGSKGVSAIQAEPQIKAKQPLYPNLPSSSQMPISTKTKLDQKQQQQIIKVYEDSTGSPKSTVAPTPFFISQYTTFPTTSFDVTTANLNNNIEKYVSTSSAKPSPLLPLLSTKSSSQTYFQNNIPFIDGGYNNGGREEQTETVSFVTAKTPTNIWYKPIINHFTATLPINGTSLQFYEKLLNFNSGSGGGGKLSSFPISTTPMPFSSSIAPFPIPTTSFKPLTGNVGGDFYHQHPLSQNKDDIQPVPIIFKVWKLHEGKLTLESEREIPHWALQGYSLPTPGTILNLQQIPLEFQPFVVDAVLNDKKTGMNSNEENNGDNHVVATNGKAHVWKQLPVLSSTGITSIRSKTPQQLAQAYQQLLLEDEKKQKYNEMKGAGGGNQHKIASANKRPISINYVLWNNPVPSFSNSPSTIIISTTPPPLLNSLLLSRQPTPVSYFPSSTITSLSPIPTNTEGLAAAVDYDDLTKNSKRRPNSNSIYNSFTAPLPTATPTVILPTATTASISKERIDLLFQNYFQYFSTPTPSSTPAFSTGTRTGIVTTTAAPIIKGDFNGNLANSPAWDDLKRLILRLATNHKRINGNKTSIAQEENQTSEEYFDHLGTVAAIALIMSYLRNQYDSSSSMLPPSYYEQALDASSSTPKPPLPSLTTTPYPHQHFEYQSVYPLITKASPTVAPAPYGVTDDMTPPHHDQLWATVYPLFQHLLNNPNYKFVPPNSAPVQTNQILLSSAASPIPFTEPPVMMTSPISGSGVTYDKTQYNHYSQYNNNYASYYPSASSVATTKSPYHVHRIGNVFITEIPQHGATTQRIPAYRLENKLGEVSDIGAVVEDPGKSSLPLKVISLVALSKLAKKKHGKKGSKKKKKVAALAAGAVGATLLRRMLNMAQQSTKYMLDFKYEIDFYDIIRKKLLYWLAYRYMPVVMVLAFGLIPLSLSFVPLLYKEWWARRKPKLFKPKFIKIPFPVPIYKHIHHHTPHQHSSWGNNHHHNHFGQYSPPVTILPEQHQSGEMHYPQPNPPPHMGYDDNHEQNYENHNNYYNDDGNSGVIHINGDGPPSALPPNYNHDGYNDHYHAAASEENKFPEYPSSYSTPLETYDGGGSGYHTNDNEYGRVVNSFNYNGDDNDNHYNYDNYNNKGDVTSPPLPPPSYSHFHDKSSYFKYQNGWSNDPNAGDNPEVHVHLHDDPAGTSYHPQYHVGPTFSPSELISYSSYNQQELQPYPASKGFEVGYDIGQMLSGVTNKQDMEILKILLETKKAKLNKLLEMWKLAKYGVGVASDAAKNVAGGLAGIYGAASPTFGGGGGADKRTAESTKMGQYSNSFPVPPNFNKNDGGYFGKRRGAAGKRRKRKRRRKAGNDKILNGTAVDKQK